MFFFWCFQEVPEETWAAWNSVFDRLDTDGDNVMSPGELRQIGSIDLAVS